MLTLSCFNVAVQVCCLAEDDGPSADLFFLAMGVVWQAAGGDTNFAFLLIHRCARYRL